MIDRHHVKVDTKFARRAISASDRATCAAPKVGDQLLANLWPQADVGAVSHLQASTGFKSLHQLAGRTHRNENRALVLSDLYGVRISLDDNRMFDVFAIVAALLRDEEAFADSLHAHGLPRSVEVALCRAFARKQRAIKCLLRIFT
uniref:Uncharacterized protein n=1 Tax=Mycena chlorophos TaxID=658473 RepID=A0ABQ0L8B0_MYCCL|nr:predicted protein [Mycena chlorophos]